MSTPSTDNARIAASLICADLCNLERDVAQLEAAGADFLHVDVLDGHFSPSLPIGLDTIRQLRGRTKLPFDAHLMVTNNEFFIEELARIGVQRLCLHAESAFHLDRLLGLIRDHGIAPGVALMPATPLTALQYVTERVDFILLMLINPGFAGHAAEKQVPYARRKIADCRRVLDDSGRQIAIEIDGRVSLELIPDLVAAGADIVVGGSGSVFLKGDTWAGNIRRTRDAIALGLQRRQPRG